MPERATFLITGAAGNIAGEMRPVLRKAFDLRLLDIRVPDDVQADERFLKGSIVDRRFLDEALSGVDFVAHLACRHAPDLSFEDTLDVNYRGTVNLLEAAVSAGVRHVVFASSNHGWGFYTRDETPVEDDAPVRPDGWYGISKVWGEAVMAHYACACGLSSTSLRIGNARPAVMDERALHMWVSPHDIALMIGRAVRREDGRHHAVFCNADCPDPFFGNAGAQALGLSAGQDPMMYLADAGIPTARPVQGTETYLGGHFAVPRK